MEEDTELKELSEMTVEELSKEKRRLYVLIATKEMSVFTSELFLEKINRIEEELKSRGVA